MKVSANSIRASNILLHNDELFVVSKTPEHTKPGKGPAYVQVEMKNIRTGNKIRERFLSSIYLERVQLEQTDYQYLYTEGDEIYLMDLETFEQIQVKADIASSDVRFLSDNMIVTIESFEGSTISMSLPMTVVAQIEETGPVLKEATATASYKPAMLTNGIRVMVPPYLTSGEMIVVKTEDNTFVERAK